MINKLTIYAAGSLRHAFSIIAEQFQQHCSITIDIEFAPAGLLCQKIIDEARKPIAQLFASANTAHPQQLVKLGFAKSQRVFAHNQLCLVARNEPKFSHSDWLAMLLDEKTRIGISTPGRDPCGDYAFALFDNIEQYYPKQGQRLKHQAEQLVGGTLYSALPVGVNPAEYFLSQNNIDLFIGYISNTRALQQNPLFTVLTIPNMFNPVIDYSMALLSDSHQYAQRFMDFVLSQDGQSILQSKGFLSVNN